LGTRPHARSFRGVTEELTVRTRTRHSRARPRCRTFSLRSGLNPNNSLSSSRRHVSHDLRTASCLINQRTVYVYQEFVNRRHQCGSDGIMWVHFALDNFESCEPTAWRYGASREAAKQAAPLCLMWGFELDSNHGPSRDVLIAETDRLRAAFVTVADLGQTTSTGSFLEYNIRGFEEPVGRCNHHPRCLQSVRRSRPNASLWLVTGALRSCRTAGVESVAVRGRRRSN
ncbi:hypothetical protein BKA83DRAFT_4381253, partial [Pisolithus microcarpus]